MQCKYVIGNWKLNPATQAEAAALATALIDIAGQKNPAVAVGCTPSFLHLSTVAEKLASSALWVGAQDVCAHSVDVGAYTGDVSAAQLVDAGARFVLVGHSERRSYYAEDNTLLAAKISQAIAADLVVVLCVGETQSEYKAGETLGVLDAQLAVLDGLDIPEAQLIIAYEPVWAIGTGLTPTVPEVVAVHESIKKTLSAKNLADICVLYGGSVNANNAADFAAADAVGGALVGGASLKAQSFKQIIDAFSAA